MGVADGHARAPSQPFGLDDQRQPLRAHVVLVEVCGRERGKTCGWNAMAVEKILGEGFRTLEPRRAARRAKAAPIGRGEAVDDAGAQWSFGSYDGEADI